MPIQKRAKFWYSEKQSHALAPRTFEAFMLLRSITAKDDPETQAFVTLKLNDELVEMQYTEMYTGDDPNYTSNWDDAVLLADTTEYSIRVQVLNE